MSHAEPESGSQTRSAFGSQEWLAARAGLRSEDPSSQSPGRISSANALASDGGGTDVDVGPE